MDQNQGFCEISLGSQELLEGESMSCACEGAARDVHSSASYGSIVGLWVRQPAQAISVYDPVQIPPLSSTNESHREAEEDILLAGLLYN